MTHPEHKIGNRARFRQQDVTRGVKGCEKAGMRVERVEISPNGGIVICAAEATPTRRGTMDHLKRG